VVLDVIFLDNLGDILAIGAVDFGILVSSELLEFFLTDEAPTFDLFERVGLWLSSLFFNFLGNLWGLDYNFFDLRGFEVTLEESLAIFDHVFLNMIIFIVFFISDFNLVGK